MGQDADCCTQRNTNQSTERELPDTDREPDDGQPVCSCCGRKRKRSDQEMRALVNRLNRMEGQIRGIRRMLEEDAYCPDILTQVSAVNAALNGFSRELLSQHIRTCVRDDLIEGKEETLDELMETLRKFMK